MTIWTVAAILAAIAGMEGLRRVRLHRRGGERGVTDEMIQRIERHGQIEMDEPLDLEAIEDEEARFWEETWDEPEEI